MWSESPSLGLLIASWRLCAGAGSVYMPAAGVAGHSTLLPCSVTPALQGDTLLLILWYKIGISSPVYT